MKQKISKHFIILIILLTGIFFLTSCTKPSITTQPTLSADEYLQLAIASEGIKKQRYLLKAANRLVQDRQLNAARRILRKVNDPGLNEQLYAEKQIIVAQIQLLKHEPTNAITLLTDIETNITDLPTNEQTKLFQVLANAYEAQGDILNSITERNKILPLLSESDRKTYLLKIWESLQTLNENSLQNLMQQAITQDQRGWISLALISNHSNLDSSQLLSTLTSWEKQFPNHPAQTLLSNTSANKTIMTPPKKIALLLPLQGKLARQSNAIRNGFFAAYYQGKQHGYTPIIKVYNTSHGNIHEIYQKAIRQGAEFVVGPLKKEVLTKLVKTSDIAVPTLALNTLSNDNSRIPNLYQFGLSPIDEAKQIAARMKQDNHANIAVIAPKGNWAKQIAQSYEQAWESLGGRVVAQLSYTNRAYMNNDIRHLLQIDQSEQRSKLLKSILHEKIRSIPRRRKDIDAIFLLANPTQAREILPLLRFYYAGDIPVYSTSSTYPGIASKSIDRDLEGIKFDDMPWVLKSTTQLPDNLAQIRNHVKTNWPKSYAHHTRLYALGVDAYNLIPQLGKLTLLPDFGIYGASGILYLYPNQRLYRKLLWAQIIRGRPELLSTL